MNGRILDRTTGAGVPFALLTTNRAGRQVGIQADGDGRWSFAFAPGEQVRIQVLGYETAITDAGNLSPVVYLTEGTNVLPDAEVVGQRRGKGNGILWLIAVGIALKVYQSHSQRRPR